MMIFIQIPVGSMQNFSYLIGDEGTRFAAVVDPAWEVDKILKIVAENNLKISYVVNTHSHSDHTSGNAKVALKVGAKIVAHEKTKLNRDLSVKDGDTITIGNLKIQVLHTPGHSPDSICLLVKNKLLTGDTLFVEECGRTDIPGGSSEELYESLFTKLLKLEDFIEVYPGHDYGDKSHSTLGYERKHNYTLKPRSKSEFIEFMEEP